MFDEAEKVNKAVNKDINDKLEDAKLKLSGTIKEEQIKFEKGKIVFNSGNGSIISLIFLVLALISFSLSKLINPLITFSIAGAFLVLAFLFDSKQKNFLVLDYEKNMIYYEKRDSNNKIISKDIFIKPKELLAVGVNNHIGEGTKYDPGDLVTGEREESNVALLKSNGELYPLYDFLPKHYPNDCLIADAISILFNVPAVKSNKEEQLKVIKTALNYKLTTEPLKRDSIFVIIMKKALWIVLGMGFSLVVLFVLSEFVIKK